MRSAFSLYNLNDLKFLLELSENGYVDVVISNDSIAFISNSSSSFGYITYKAYGDLKNAAFRVKRDLFLRLADNGIIEFELERDVVWCKIFDSRRHPIVKFSFLPQEVFTEAYSEKLACLKDDRMPLDLGDVRAVLSVAKTLGGNVSFSDNLASTPLPGRGKLFQRTLVADKFAIQASVLSRIIAVGNKVFTIRNYVGFSKNNLFVLYTKYTPQDNTDFEYLMEQKSAYVCNIDFSFLRSVVSKLKIQGENVTLNLNEKSATLVYDDINIIMPVTVTDVKQASGYEASALDLSFQIIRDVFSKFQSPIITFRKKKNYLQFEQDNLFVFL